jgi:nucleotide-binding universal stress UspA family protein
MLKRILIPLDPSPYTETALEIGTTMARMYDAELTGLVILDLPGIEKSIGPIPLGGLYYADRLEKQKEKEANERIHSLLKKFGDICKNEGVHYREAEQQGSPSERILQEAIFFDAIIIGMRTHFHFETSEKPGDSLEKIMEETITPIYAVPEKYNFPDIPNEKIRVLIAFDGSLPAARAMQRFAQLVKPNLFEVTLLISEGDKAKADYYLNQAQAYLTIHGIEKIHKKWVEEDIIDAIEEIYLDWAHVVVVGAHSKKGIFGFKVGSLTTHLIKANRKPLLIGQ